MPRCAGGVVSEGPHWTGPTRPNIRMPEVRPPGLPPEPPPGQWVPSPRPAVEPGPTQQWGAPAQEWGQPPQQEWRPGGPEWSPETQEWTDGRQAWSPEPGGQPGGPGFPGQPPRRRNQGLIIGIVVAAVVLLVAGGGVAWFLWQRHTKTTGSFSAVSASASASSGATGSAGGSVPGGAAGGGQSPSGKPSPSAGGTTTEQGALDQLTALRADSVKRLPLDGRWVAQVASKWVGVTDPLQTAANGSHTFQATDILAESLAARKTVDSPSKVYVVWGTDFGKKSSGPNGLPIWVTLVDAGYASHDNVLEWCHVTYPNLTPQQLADTCAPRQLVPPHN